MTAMAAAQNPPENQNTSPQAKNPRALEELKAAIQAQFKREFSTAKTHYLAARELDPSLKGIDYQLAVIAFNEVELDAACELLERSIASGQEAGSSHLLLGVIEGQRKNYDKSIEEFEKAAKVMPADPGPFYNMSETYREVGRPTKAIDALRKAMQRNPADPLYPLKLRLARVEAGDEKNLDTETAAQLKLESPAGDWLLTAAAIALHRGFFDEAAVLLDRCRQTINPGLFLAILQDPVFKKYAKEPKIAIFYDVEISTGSPTPSPR